MKNSLSRFWLVTLFVVTNLFVTNGQPSTYFYLPDGYDICPYDSITFINSSSEIYDSTAWYVNGIFAHGDISPMWDTALPGGNYEIRMEIYYLGGWNGEYTEWIDVKGNPGWFMPNDFSEFCPNENIQFEIYLMGNDSVSFMEWNMGDGSTNIQGNPVFHSYSVEDTFNVTVVWVNACGDTFDITQSIVVRNGATPEVYIDPWLTTSVCRLDPVILSGPKNLSTYSWNFGDGTIKNGRKVSHFYTVNFPQSFPVVLTATNSCGGQGTDTIYIDVSDTISANAYFSWEPEGESPDMCANTPIKFYPWGSGQYYWDFFDGGTSEEPFPVHVFNYPGEYWVNLMVENGCGDMATYSEIVYIDDFSAEPIFGVEAYFEIPYVPQNQTSVTICPLEQVVLNAHVPDESADYQYTWTITDYGTLNGRKVTLDFTDKPVDTTYWIDLMVTDNCGRMGYSMLEVYVDQNKGPDAYLQVFPHEICPNEMVYFFDDAHTNNSGNPPYFYEIFYGDGNNTGGPFNDYQIPQNEILRAHSYAVGGPYTFTFRAINVCGNETVYTDKVHVNTTPGRPKQYIIENSTAESEGPEFMYMPEDWTNRNIAGDHKFMVQTYFSPPSPSDSIYYLFFYLDGMMDITKPDGFVEVKAVSPYNFDSIMVSVPTNTPAVNVEIVGGFYCDTSEFMMHLPDTIGFLVDVSMDTLGPFLLVPDNTTYIYRANYNYAQIDLFYSSCMGPSAFPDELMNMWVADEGDGEYTLLEFFEDEYTGDTYEIFYTTDPNDRSQYISLSRGDASYSDPDLYLDNEAADVLCAAMMSGMYYYTIYNDTLMLTPNTDGCSTRQDTITGKIFTSFKKVNSACPNDSVQFAVFGGTNWEWHFPDVTIAGKRALSHTFDSAGIYEVMCIVSNSCDAFDDTLYTTVSIDSFNYPTAHFGQSKGFATVGEDINFIYFEENGMVHAYYMTWDMGDGSTIYEDYGLQSVQHSYSAIGDYTVTLTVENGCGIALSTRNVRIEEPCDLSVRFSIDIDTNTNEVTFINRSIGVWNELKWRFDGGPVETYNVGGDTIYRYMPNGPHYAELQVINTVDGCQDFLQKDYVVGNLDCFADFNYFIDGTTVYFENTSTGAINEFYWDFGTGNDISFVPNPEFTYPAAGEYWVKLIASGPTCSSVKEDLITVGILDNTYCRADFEYEVDVLTVQFTNTSTSQGSIVTGYYDFGDGNFEYDEPNPVHTYAEPGVYLVCGGIEDEFGCFDLFCQDVFVGDVDCYADFTVIPYEAAQGALFKADTTTGSEYYWDFGDGLFDNGPEVEHYYDFPGFYPVVLTVLDNETGCVAEMVQEVQINPSGSELCNVDYNFIIDSATRTVTFKAVTNSTFTDWFWDFGDGGFSQSPDTVYTYVEPGVYDVALFAYNEGDDCFAERYKLITITGGTTDQLTARFSNLSIPGTRKVKFKNKSTGNIDQLYWTFGDGTFADNVDSLTHEYPFPGFWFTCLSVFNNTSLYPSDKCKDIFVEDITDQCRINAEFSKIIDPTNNTVTFKDKTTGGAFKWFWNFGDANSSSKRNPVHKYEQPGYYLVTLSVSDTTGQCIDHTAKFIQVGRLDCKSDFEFAVNPNTNIVKFTNKALGNISDYFWAFDDGDFSIDPDPVKVFRPGNHMVSLTVSTATGCVDHYYDEVQVGTVDCYAKFTVHVDTNNVAHFNSRSIGNASEFLWMFGDGNISEEEDPIYIYSHPGIYWAGLFVSTGSCMDYYEEPIIVGKRGIDMQAAYVYQVDTAMKTVDFFDRSLGVDDSTNYVWDFGDDSISLERDPVHTYSEGDFYWVCLTILGRNNMQNTECQMISVAPPLRKNCKSDFIYTVDSASLTASFTSTSLGVGPGDEYEWRYGHGVTEDGSSTATHTFDSAGFYNVGLKIRNTTTRCNHVEYKLINVGKGRQGIRAAFGYDIDTNNLKAGGYPVDFTGSSNPPKPSKFSWDFGDEIKAGGYSTTSRVTHIYGLAGVYTVCYTVTDPNTEASDTYCEDVEVGKTNIQEIITKLTKLNNRPNPFYHYTNITFALPQRAFVELTIVDNLGRTIETIVNTTKDRGSHEIIWDTSGLAPGVYYLKLKTSLGVSKTRMIIKR